MWNSLKNLVDRKIKDYLGHVGKKKNQTRSCSVGDVVVLLSVDSDIEEYRAESYSTKEPETLEWIDRYFGADDVFYDIGANIGLYTLYAGVKAKCKVISFEPESQNYAKLNQNIFINRLSDLVTPYCLALTDRFSFDRFYLNPSDFSGDGAPAVLAAGGALHSFGETVDYQGEAYSPLHKQGMIGVALDDLWMKYSFDFPTKIKIDVDGLEGKIIQGGRQTLNDPRLTSLLIELTADESHHYAEIMKFIEECGFQLLPPETFNAHSVELQKGTAYANCQNHIFVRG
ncbi:MAG: FkbM family methyltransferase [bacterium]|nr:FkbM family methyltransferase [bacterium]